MRIIAGKKRGMKLLGIEGESIRPTTDRVKENIFNMIAPHVADAVVLDLVCRDGRAFAGGNQPRCGCGGFVRAVGSVSKNYPAKPFKNGLFGGVYADMRRLLSLSCSMLSKV